jgi:hypothetical protein
MLKPWKVGTVRWTASYYDKLEFDSWTLRTVRKRTAWFVCYVKDVTWVKRSSKHFDWGWATNVPDMYRRRCWMGGAMPYHATKVGAIAALIAELRREIKEYGEDFAEDYDGELDPEPALKIKLKRAQAAQVKLRKT